LPDVQDPRERDGNGDYDGDGVLDFFEYIFGSNPVDPADSGSAIEAQPDESGDGVVFKWSVASGISEGVDYVVRYSINLLDWDPLPAGHLLVEGTGDPKPVELTLPGNVGPRAFVRLQRPPGN
jgi:hypothetical protein